MTKQKYDEKVNTINLDDFHHFISQFNKRPTKLLKKYMKTSMELKT